MPSWLNLYSNIGSYESVIYDISSSFTYYDIVKSLAYEINGGKLDVQIRVSYDGGNTWNEWLSLIDSPISPFDNEVSLANARLQYRVLFEGDANNRPSFSSIDLKLYGAKRIINTGDRVCKPEIWIRKTNGSGSITLTNRTNNQTLKFENLNNGEEIYIDNENEDIVSSLPSIYRFDDHNGVFLKLEVGENILTGTGDFELDIKLEFKTLQG